MTFDPARARKDFPILTQTVHGHPLVFLDSAASAQKPQSVIDAITHTYTHDYANIHRGVYELSVRATEAVESARRRIARFIGAAPEETVFVRNATEAINLVASSYGRAHVGEGDEILITHMEHHANIVPWQLLCGEKNAALRVAPIDDRGELILEEFAARITPRTRLIAVTHVSNALGTVNPVEEIVRIAHEHGVPVLLDGAQAAPHGHVDVRALDCDFYVFSGHKLYGPSGVGVLYGKSALLAAMPPYMGGGEMILSVTMEKSTYQQPPHRFEAGTPDIAGIVGLGAAVDYLEALDLDAVSAYERDLLAYATEALLEVPGLRMIGTSSRKVAVLSFVLDGIHPHDIGTILDREGIAVRTGHHCAQPVMDRFGIAATARASLALYNTREDVDALIRGLHAVQRVFG